MSGTALKIVEVGLDATVKAVQELLKVNDCVLVVTDVQAAIKDVVMVCLSTSLTAAVPELQALMQTYIIGAEAMVLAGTSNARFVLGDLSLAPP